MNVGIIGAGDQAAVRARAVQATPNARLVGRLDAVPDPARGAGGPGVLVATPLEALLAQVDAVFVAVPAADHFRVAQAATRQGVHVFLEWPPATSVAECQAVLRLSEEAGVEVGVSRPLRFHPVFETLPAAWRASLILLHREIARDEEAAWPQWLADAVDLCCALAQSSSVQRIDAEAVRPAAPWPDAVACGLRFHSGAYAQISLRRSPGRSAGTFYVGGPGFQIEAGFGEAGRALSGVSPSSENDTEAGGYERETHAFLQAVAGQHPAPVSILDGLHTMRLVERLMEKLR